MMSFIKQIGNSDLLPKFKVRGFLHIHHGEYDLCYLNDTEDQGSCTNPTVLQKYQYPSDRNNEVEEGDTTKQGERCYECTLLALENSKNIEI